MNSMKYVVLVLAGSVVIGAMSMSAHAQWTVVNLHPDVAVLSVANDVEGGQQVGIAPVGGVSCASLWTGTAASWVDLNPAGATTATASATFAPCPERGDMNDDGVVDGNDIALFVERLLRG